MRLTVPENVSSGRPAAFAQNDDQGICTPICYEYLSRSF